MVRDLNDVSDMSLIPQHALGERVEPLFREIHKAIVLRLSR